MRTYHPAGVEVEHRANGADELDLQPVAVLMDPLLLLGGGHADPEHIRPGGIDGGNHLVQICRAEFGFIGRGEGASHSQVGISDMKFHWLIPAADSVDY